MNSSTESLSRLTTSQEDFRAEFRGDKNNAFALWLRESSQNSLGHNANHCKIVTCRIPIINQGNLAFFLSNADPWKNVQQQLGSLNMNTSYGEVGRNGGGAKMATLPMVRTNSDFQLHFFSIKKGKIDHTYGTLNDNIVVAKIAPQEWTDEVQRVLGDMMKGMSVMYATPFDSDLSSSGALTFCHFPVMAALHDIMGDIPSDRMRIEYFPHLRLSSDKTYDDHLLQKDESKRLKKKSYQADQKALRSFDLKSPAQFDELFMDDQFVFDDIPAVAKIDGRIIEVEAKVTFKLYPAVRLSDGLGDQRYGLIALRGESKGKSKSDAWAPPTGASNTFVTSSYISGFESGKSLHRLAEEPHYFGKHLEQIGGILTAAIYDGDADFSVTEKSEWGSFVKENKGKRVGTVKRTPFCKVFLDIKKVISVTDETTKKAVDYQGSDLRSFFGGINEVFVTKKSYPMTELIKSVCNGILRSGNIKELDRFRSRTRDLWPSKLDKFVKLKVGRSGRFERLRVTERGGEKSISKIHVKVGAPTLTDCDLLREDGSLVKKDEVDFVLLDSGRTALGLSSIQYIDGIRGGWTIRSSALVYENERGQWEEAKSEEEWLEKSNERNSLPNKEILVYDNKSKITYRLTATHVLPKRNIKKGSGPPKAQNGTRSDNSMFKPLSPPESKIMFSNGLPLLNINNPAIDVWIDGIMSKKWHNNFYKELTEHCLRFYDKFVKCARLEEWKDRDLRDRWNNDLENYLLNMYIDAVCFDTERIQRVLKEVREKKKVHGIETPKITDLIKK